MKKNINSIINNYVNSLVSWSENFLNLKKDDSTGEILKHLIDNACENICDNPAVYKAVNCKLSALKNGLQQGNESFSIASFAINKLRAEGFSRQLIKLGNEQQKNIDQGDCTSFIKVENFIQEVCFNIPEELGPFVKENIETKSSNFELGLETMDCYGASCALDSLKMVRPDLFIEEPAQN